MNIKSWRWLILLTAFAMATTSAQSRLAVSAGERSAIEQLIASYPVALFGCDAEGYADLFAPETGYFASGFRGVMAGRDRLIELVESERHCLAPEGETRTAGGDPPMVRLERTAAGISGLVDLGTAEYQDYYVLTDAGWRFASRTVILATEKAAGIDAGALLAIQRLERSDELGDYYVADVAGTPRLLVSGVAVSVDGADVTGRAYLRTGGYVDEVYARTENGEWRILSSSAVMPAEP